MLFNVKKERDKIFSDLEESVFSKMKEICGDDENQVEKKTNNIKFVSFEDAIKELANLKKSQK